jgi:hypothetical protein
MSVFANYTHSKTVHMYRFIDRNDRVFGSPWSTGLGDDGTNGVGQLTTVESSAKSLYDGFNDRDEQEVRAELAVPVELHVVEGHFRRRQRAGSFTYATQSRTTCSLSTTTRTAISGTASTRGCSPNEGFPVQHTGSRVARRRPSRWGHPQNRIQPDGTIIKRNTAQEGQRILHVGLRVSVRSARAA